MTTERYPNTEAREARVVVLARERLAIWRLMNPGVEYEQERELREQAEVDTERKVDADLRRMLAQEREAFRELSGYVRAHLAGNDADAELKWALDLADEALASSLGDPAAETETSR